MNFWKTVLAVLTLGAVGARANDVTSRQLGVSDRPDTGNGGVPVPDSMLHESPVVPSLQQEEPPQLTRGKKNLRTSSESDFKLVFSLLEGRKNIGNTFDLMGWNDEFKKLTTTQKELFERLQKLDRNKGTRPVDRVLNDAGAFCRPVILFLIADGSNTQGRLVNVKQAMAASLTQVNPVFTGGVLFGTTARELFTFGSSGSSADEVAIVNNLTPTTTGTGPGTNIKAALDLTLLNMKKSEAQIRALVKAGYPVVVEVISDYENTVNTVPNNPTASEAAIIASYDELEGYIKNIIQTENPGGEFEIIGFSVPGLTGKNVALANRISTLHIDYPQAVDLNDPNIGITTVNERFCPVATAAPSVPVTNVPSGAPTKSPTEPPPGEVPPSIPGVLAAATVGAFAWWGRSRTKKRYPFIPNPEFEQKVKEVIATQVSRPVDANQAEEIYQAELARYNERLSEYENWLRTPNLTNDVEQVPSKASGLNNKRLDERLHTNYGISPFTTNPVIRRPVVDAQGIHQAMTRPTPPVKKPHRESEDIIRQRLANDPNMPPALILGVGLDRDYATGLLSPFHTLLSTWRKGIGPEVQEMNSSETRPTEAQPTEDGAQNRTTWQKFKNGLRGLVFGELRNDNVGRAFTRMKDGSPEFIRKPVNAASIGVQYVAQFSYGLVSFILIYAPIRFFTPKIEFAGFTPNGRSRQLTRQDLEEIKKMPNLTVEQRAYIDRIDPNTLPVAKAGYQILWEGLQSMFKSKATSASATGPVVPPVPSEVTDPNPVFSRMRAETMRRPTAGSESRPATPPLASSPSMSFGSRAMAPSPMSSSAPPLPAAPKPPPRPGTGTLPPRPGDRKPPPRPGSVMPPGGESGPHGGPKTSI